MEVSAVPAAEWSWGRGPRLRGCTGQRGHGREPARRAARRRHWGRAGAPAATSRAGPPSSVDTLGRRCDVPRRWGQVLWTPRPERAAVVDVVGTRSIPEPTHLFDAGRIVRE